MIWCAVNITLEGMALEYSHDVSHSTAATKTELQLALQAPKD